VYCPSCREPSRLPWQHAPECVEGLRAKVRWYEAGLPILAVLLLAETVLLVTAYRALGP
jgi:hypothetical protein